MSSPKVWRDVEGDLPDQFDCDILERNGSLVYVEIHETGERDWVGDFELEG